MFNSEVIYTHVCKIIQELVTSEANLSLETSLVDDLGFDSLMLITLLLRTEEEFDLCLDFDDFGFEIFDSIDSYIKFIVALIQ